MTPLDPRSPSKAPPESWRPARKAAQALAAPIQRFLSIEAASGLLLLVAVVIALALASTSLSHDYHAVLELPIGFHVGSFALEQSLHFWINEGLMTLFFFVVGLEIRRELYEGELSELRKAALPLVAALGGVLVPAAIYAAVNIGRAGSHGWAVPMATDIAFAVGVLTLLGSRVPHNLRVLLLGLAVIDDIAAIIVIAVFYSGGISLAGFGIAAIGVGAVLALRAAGMRAPAIYIVPGIVVWAGLWRAGVHPTLAGVVLGLLTPPRPWFGPSGFKETTESHLLHMEQNDRSELLGHLDEINRARREAVSPAERLIHVLHPWVAYAVMPLFALANAGVDLRAGGIAGDGIWVFAGIVLGLGVGKPVGIALATRMMGKTPGMVVVGLVGGIGFTMSLFIAQLAFGSGPLLETAKLAILVGSAVAMVAGLAYGRFSLPSRESSP
jgi:NhaA family Na+:H+ antiporter